MNTTSPSVRPCFATDEATVATLMTAIAAGDQPAIWTLRELADEPLRSRVRGELRRLGVRYEVEDLDAMVTDAVLAIAEVAGSWRPGGAPPWAWAYRRILNEVHKHVGTFADSLDDVGRGDADDALGWLAPHAVRVVGSDTALDPADVIPATRDLLTQLAERQPELAVLDEALSELASARDAALWLSMLKERTVGNHRPAVTIGTRFDMQPATVRKAFQRVRQRLQDAVAAGRFPELAALPGVVAAEAHQQVPA